MKLMVKCPQRYIFFIVLFSVFWACNEDPYSMDLGNTKLKLYDTLTTNLTFKTYQTPPFVGSHNALYLGKNKGYEIPLNLLTLGDLSILDDSSYTLDSAYFQFTMDTSGSDSIIPDFPFSLGFFEKDSNYSESSTNYTNIDWLTTSYDKIMSYSIEDTSTLLTRVRFNIDTSLIHLWIDTSTVSQMFILEAVEELPFIQAFYSREDNLNYPFLKVFYHYTDTVSDTVAAIVDTSTTVKLTSDLSIINPPSIIESSLFDSSFTYLGSGAGLRTVLISDIDSIGIPKEAVIVRADLILTASPAMSNSSNISNFTARYYILSDTVTNWNWGEIFSQDIYSAQLVSGEYPVKDSTLTFDVTYIVQSWILGTQNNLGLKLVTLSSNSLFDYAAFYSSSADSAFKPYLEVIYESP